MADGDGGAQDPAAERFDPASALSGESGIVAGRRRRLRALGRDLGDDAAAWARLIPLRLRRAARGAAGGSVLVLGVYSEHQQAAMARAVEELRRSRRPVRFALAALGRSAPQLAGDTLLEGLAGRGKFENLNALLAHVGEPDADWIVVVDDDVELPRGFLDGFLFCCERFGLQLAQPALRHASHGAWAIFRRERWTVARVSRMVEIGPLTAFARPLAAELLPFPPLRMGWGLDSHWAALAQQRRWRLGVVDATPIRHESRPTASGYDREDAVQEMRDFLELRPHIDRQTALEVVARLYSW